MKEEQDKRWNDLSEESKNEVMELYHHAKEVVKESEYGNTAPTDLFEQRYGIHNLNPKPRIKTWDDLEKAFPKTYGNEDIELFDFNEFAWDASIIRKCIATLKISELIKIAYDGLVTDDEWKNINLPKYVIIPHNVKNELRVDVTYTRNDKQYIAFHSEELAEEFMSYEENRNLIELYYLL